MRYQPIRFEQKFSLFDGQWQPKVVAEMNDYHFKVARLQGDFVWHEHRDRDEAFILINGSLRIDFRDDVVDLAAGKLLVVPMSMAARTRVYLARSA